MHYCQMCRNINLPQKGVCHPQGHQHLQKALTGAAPARGSSTIERFQKVAQKQPLGLRGLRKMSLQVHSTSSLCTTCTCKWSQNMDNTCFEWCQMSQHGLLATVKRPPCKGLNMAMKHLQQRLGCIELLVYQ